jgi:hypothetical protein
LRSFCAIQKWVLVLNKFINNFFIQLLWVSKLLYFNVDVVIFLLQVWNFKKELFWFKNTLGGRVIRCQRFRKYIANWLRWWIVWPKKSILLFNIYLVFKINNKKWIFQFLNLSTYVLSVFFYFSFPLSVLGWFWIFVFWFAVAASLFHADPIPLILFCKFYLSWLIENFGGFWTFSETGTSFTFAFLFCWNIFTMGGFVFLADF